MVSQARGRLNHAPRAVRGAVAPAFAGTSHKVVVPAGNLQALMPRKQRGVSPLSLALFVRRDNDAW